MLEWLKDNWQALAVAYLAYAGLSALRDLRLDFLKVTQELRDARHGLESLSCLVRECVPPAKWTEAQMALQALKAETRVLPSSSDTQGRAD